MATGGAELPTAAMVTEAAARLAPWIRRTPVITVAGPGARPLVLKLEGLQRSGSFKIRGALNTVLALGPAARRGLITASGGNHGLGVAWAGLLLGMPVHVCVPSTTPAIKREALIAARAEVEVVPGHYPDAERVARAHARSRDLAFIHAYDDPHVIAGQGTVVAELLADAPEVRTVVVAVGGGGLASGAVLAIEAAAHTAASPRRVVGIEPFGAPTLHEALRAGCPVALDRIESVAADSLGAGQAGRLTFSICQAGLDRVELVEDDAIREARRWLWNHLRQVYEYGAAAGLAAISTGLLDSDPGPLGVILCGSNGGCEGLSPSS